MSTAVSRICAWGNGLALRLTKPMAKIAGVAEGSQVRVCHQKWPPRQKEDRCSVTLTSSDLRRMSRTIFAEGSQRKVSATADIRPPISIDRTQPTAKIHQA